MVDENEQYLLTSSLA